jgi:hypothetical protein
MGGMNLKKDIIINNMSDGLTEAMRGLKPREYNSTLVEELINETSEEELSKLNKQMKKIKKNKVIKSKPLLIKDLPDPKMHKIYSFIKSTIRISGYMIIPFDITIAAIILIMSEIVGIVEETV